MNSEKLQTIHSEKRVYETPTLTVYGNVEDITQAVFRWGSGDAFMVQHHLPDVLAS